MLNVTVFFIEIKKILIECVRVIKFPIIGWSGIS